MVTMAENNWSYCEESDDGPDNTLLDPIAAALKGDE